MRAPGQARHDLHDFAEFSLRAKRHAAYFQRRRTVVMVGGSSAPSFSMQRGGAEGKEPYDLARTRRAGLRARSNHSRPSMSR